METTERPKPSQARPLSSPPRSPCAAEQNREGGGRAWVFSGPAPYVQNLQTWGLMHARRRRAERVGGIVPRLGDDSA